MRIAQETACVLLIALLAVNGCSTTSLATTALEAATGASDGLSVDTHIGDNTATLNKSDIVLQDVDDVTMNTNKQEVNTTTTVNNTSITQMIMNNIIWIIAVIGWMAPSPSEMWRAWCMRGYSAPTPTPTKTQPRTRRRKK